MNVIAALAHYRIAVLQQFRDRHRGENGFTLIELLVVIMIFGLVSVIAISMMGQMRKRVLANQPEAGKPVEDTYEPDVVTVDPPRATSEGSGSALTFFLIAGGVLLLIGVVFAGLFLVSRIKHQRALGTLREGRYTAAYEKFDGVRLAWGSLNADPLSVLEHSRLLDVSFPKTAAFLDTFHILQDRMNVVSKAPNRLTEQDLKEIEDMAAKVSRQWDSAKVAAERASYNWLPEAERTHAATAAKMLRLAANEAASPGERANAAERAAVLLRRIESFHFPAMTMEAIEGSTRLMIAGPSSAVAV